MALNSKMMYSGDAFVPFLETGLAFWFRAQLCTRLRAGTSVDKYHL